MTGTPTLLYLDVFGAFDASRSGLVEAFCEAGVSVIVANFAYFPTAQSTAAAEALVAALDRSGTRIDGLLSINVAGLSAPIADYAHRRSTNHVVWFVDMPHFFPDLALLDRAEALVACSNYAEHPRLRGAPWVPFAGAAPIPLPRNAEAAIGFLGSLHPIARHALRSMHGLVGSRSGHVPPGRDLFERVRNPSFLIDEAWSLPDGTPVQPADYLNFLSSLHRIQNLSYFADLGLEIQGPVDWISELWTSAPHLLRLFSERSVSGRAEMRDYLSRYEICLNIFHLQNMKGGPNFRSFDAASNYTPCLSQYNEDCVAIFPHGEAALYYRNADEARYLARTLIGDRFLRQHVANGAAEVVRSAHTFAHRVRTFCRHLGITPPAHPEPSQFRRMQWDTEQWQPCEA